eukprot:g7799.t1
MKSHGASLPKRSSLRLNASQTETLRHPIRSWFNLSQVSGHWPAAFFIRLYLRVEGHPSCRIWNISSKAAILWAGFWTDASDPEGHKSRTSKERLFDFADRIETQTVHPSTHLGRMAEENGNLANCQSPIANDLKSNMWSFFSFSFVYSMRKKNQDMVVALVHKEMDGARALSESILFNYEVPSLGVAAWGLGFWSPQVLLIDLLGTCSQTSPALREQLFSQLPSWYESAKNMDGFHGWHKNTYPRRSRLSWTCLDCPHASCHLDEHLANQVKQLLQVKRQQDDKDTKLIEAAKEGRAHAVEDLLENGAEPRPCWVDLSNNSNLNEINPDYFKDTTFLDIRNTSYNGDEEEIWNYIEKEELTASTNEGEQNEGVKFSIVELVLFDFGWLVDVLSVQCLLGYKDGRNFEVLVSIFALPALGVAALILGLCKWRSPFYGLKYAIAITSIAFQTAILRTIENQFLCQARSKMGFLLEEGAFLRPRPFIACGVSNVIDPLRYRLCAALAINGALIPGGLCLLGVYITRQIQGVQGLLSSINPVIQCDASNPDTVTLHFATVQVAAEKLPLSREDLGVYVDLPSQAMWIHAAAYVVCIAESIGSTHLEVVEADFSTKVPEAEVKKKSLDVLKLKLTKDAHFKEFSGKSQQIVLQEARAHAQRLSKRLLYRAIAKRVTTGPIWVGVRNSFHRFADKDPLICEGLQKFFLLAMARMCAGAEDPVDQMHWIAAALAATTSGIVIAKPFGSKSRNDLATVCFGALSCTAGLLCINGFSVLQFVPSVVVALFFLHLQLMPGDIMLQTHWLQAEMREQLGVSEDQPDEMKDTKEDNENGKTRDHKERMPTELPLELPLQTSEWNAGCPAWCSELRFSAEQMQDQLLDILNKSQLSQEMMRELPKPSFKEPKQTYIHFLNEALRKTSQTSSVAKASSVKGSRRKKKAKATPVKRSKRLAQSCRKQLGGLLANLISACEEVPMKWDHLAIPYGLPEKNCTESAKDLFLHGQDMVRTHLQVLKLEDATTETVALLQGWYFLKQWIIPLATGVKAAILWAGFWTDASDPEGHKSRTSKERLFDFADQIETQTVHPSTQLGTMAEDNGNLADCQGLIANELKSNMWSFFSFSFVFGMMRKNQDMVVALVHKEMDGARPLSESILFQYEVPSLGMVAWREYWSPHVVLIDLLGTCKQTSPALRAQLFSNVPAGYRDTLNLFGLKENWTVQEYSRRSRLSWTCLDCPHSSCHLDEHLARQVKQLLEAGREQDQKDTRLIKAAKEGKASAVEELLNTGAQANCQDLEHGGADDKGFKHGYKGDTPLHFAAREGYDATALVLLNHGASVDATNEKLKTPLHLAAKRGHAAVAKILLGHHADVDAKDQSGRAPLHLAAESGDVDMAKLLLKHHAKVDVEELEFGWTPLHFAAKGDHLAMAVLLLEANASLRLKDKNGADALSVATVNLAWATQALLFEIQGSRFRIAGKIGEVAVAEILLKRYPNALDLAAMSGQVAVAKLLLKHRADVNSTINGLTALHSAAKENKADMVELLLQHNANVNARDFSGETPLHQAAGCGAGVRSAGASSRVVEVELLLKAKAEVNPRDQSHQTPLSCAKSTEVAKVLKDHGGME